MNIKKHKLPVIILVILSLFFVSYLIFRVNIKAGIIVLTIQMKDGKFRSSMMQFIERNADSVFFKPLLKLCTHSNRHISDRALSILISNTKSLNPHNTDELIAFLNSKDWTLRKFAAEKLGELKVVKAVGPLIKKFNENDIHTRSTIMYALMEIGDTKAITFLAKQLKNNDRNIREEVAILLSDLNYPEAIDPIFEMWLSKDQSRQLRGKIYLGKFSDEEKGKRLLKIAEDKNNINRIRALEFLEQIKYAKAVGPVIKILEERNKSWTLTTKVVRILTRSGDKKAFQSVIKALNDKTFEPRSLCARYLGEFGDKRAVKPLIAALNDSDSYTRMESVTALGKLKDKLSVLPLIAVLNNDTPKMKSLAAHSLGEIKDKRAVLPLIDNLKDKNPNLRNEIVFALCELKDKRAVEPLMEIIKQDPTTIEYREKINLANVMAYFGEKRAVKPIIGFLKFKDGDIRKYAIIALGKLGDPSAIPYLERIPSDIENEARLVTLEVEKVDRNYTKEDKDFYIKNYMHRNRYVIEQAKISISQIKAKQKKIVK